MFLFNKLKECRMKSGLSLEKVMVQLGNQGLEISRATVNSHENGETLPNAKQLEHYARLYERPVSYFFNGKQTE